MVTRVTLLCDNRDVANWGCRATSIALRQLLDDGSEVEAHPRSLATRTWMVRRGWSPPPMGRAADRLLGRVTTIAGDRRLVDVLSAVSVLGPDVETSARRVERASRRGGPLEGLVQSIADADCVVVNGEGSMIFTPRPRRDLLFQVAMMRVAQRAGVPVHYVNCVISPSPQHDPDLRFVAQCFGVLADCASVLVRDPCSADFARRLGADEANLAVVPDALFSWAGRSELLRVPASLAVLEPFPERPGAFVDPTQLSSGYVCVAGASTPPGVDRALWVAQFESIVAGLRRHFGCPVLLVAPDDGDCFLSEVAERTSAPLVRPTAPIGPGCALLAGAELFVSGRYHPSIMASLGGTPMVHFQSNSHKLEGLRRLLRLPAEPLPRAGDRDFAAQILEGSANAVRANDRARVIDAAGTLGAETRAAYASTVLGAETGTTL